MKNLNNATTWALSVFDSDLSPTQKLICLYLRTHMNDYRDVAWPSKPRIAAKCGLGVRCVQDNMKLICKKGYLIENGWSQVGTIRYEIRTPALDAPPHITAPPPAADAPELTKELTNTTTTRRKAKFTPPTLLDVQEYCSDKNLIIDPHYFHEHYTLGDWKDVAGNPVKNWKQKLLTWNKREEKKNANTRPTTGNKNQRRLSPTERAVAARQAAYDRAATRTSDMGHVVNHDE